MAAALLRGGRTGLCVNCIRRELCRLSWRPQIALLSSKTSDPRKQQPRRTHIKKAKPQPAVDVAKLLEQLFSQRRPDTSPTAKGPAARTSSRPPLEPHVFTKPAATSALKAPASTTSSFQNVQTSATSSRTEHAAPPPAIPTVAAHLAMAAPSESPKSPSSPILESPAPTSETKLETPSPVVTAASPSGDVYYTATPASATSVTPPVPESEVETLESTPATVDVIKAETPAAHTSTSASSSASVEHIEELIVDAATASPVGTVESAAVFVESTEDPTLCTAAESVETSLEDNATASPSGDASYTATPASSTSVTHPVATTAAASPVFSMELPLAETTVVPSAEPVELFSAVPVQAASAHIAESDVETLEYTPATLEAVAETTETVESAAVFSESVVDPTLGTATESVETSPEDNATASLSGDGSYTATTASSTSVTHSAETTVVPSAEPAELFSAVPIQAASAHIAESEVETLQSTPATLEAVAETPAVLTSTPASSSPSVEHIDEPIVDASTASPVFIESTVESMVDPAESVETSPEDNAMASPSGDASYTATPTSALFSAVPVQVASAHIAESGVETLESTPATVEAVAEPPAALTSTPAPNPPSVEHIDEPIVDAATASLVGTVKSAAVFVESTVETSTVNPTLDTDVEPVETSREDKASDALTLNALTDNTIEPTAMSVKPKVESTVESSTCSGTGLEKSEDRGAGQGNGVEITVKDLTLQPTKQLDVPEAMTLESVTLAEITALLESLQTDVLFQTTSALDNKADTLTQDVQAQTVNGTQQYSKAAAETAENLTEALSENDSLFEEVVALEAETELLMQELLFSVPAPDSRNDCVKPRSVLPSESGNEDVIIAEAMTLESVTLAEVEANVGSLEADVLKETKTALEKEAEVLSKEEHTGEYAALKNGTTMVEEKAEPDNFTLDSLSEAAEALEAETDLVLGALFYSGSGPVPSTKSTVVIPESQSTLIDNVVFVTEPGSQEKVSKSVIDGEEEGQVFEAMTVESVTLAEVEAVLGTLENVALTETMAQLEKEAEVHAKEERMGEESNVVEDVAMSENTEAADLTLDSLSEATEALEVETDVIMQAMFCVSGPVLETTPESTNAPPESQNTAREVGCREVVVENLISEETVSKSVIGGETEENILDSMMLESVTLPEVDARVEILENVGLTETTTQLEKEAEILSKEESVGEEKTIVKDGSVSEEKTEAEVLTGKSLSKASRLPGAQQAETDMLMEELHFSAPGHGEESLGGEQTVVDEALTIETLTMSEVETLVEALEGDVLTDLIAEEPQEQEMPAEQKMSSEAVEADIPSEAEILNNTEVLAEAAEALEHASAVILQDLLCSMSGPMTVTTTVQTAQPDSPPPLTAPLPTPQPSTPTRFSQEDEEGAGLTSVPPAGRGEETVTEGGIEESTQTEALVIDEGWDPVQRLFLEKIREYNTRSRMSGGPVEAGPDYEKRLSEEKAKLHRLYGGGDLESFPQFTFTEPLLGDDSSK